MNLDSIIDAIGMTPYNRTEYGVLYCADCLDILPKIPDKSIDLVLTDPQYGIGESNEKNKSRGKLSIPTDYGHYDWDKKRLPANVLASLRTARHQVVFGGNYYMDVLPPLPCWLVWDKDNGSNDFADCELAWTSLPGAVRRIKWRWAGLLQENMGNKEYRVHPTQKPLPVMQWAIGVADKKVGINNLILDPFAGSGTTLVAAKQLGRKYIGVEINEEYCKICVERLRQEELF